MIIKKLLLFLCLVISYQVIDAQTGLSFAYKSMKARNWERVIFNSNVLPGVDKSPLREGQYFGFDYKIPFKNRRIEFVPEINYSRYIRGWVTSMDEYTELSVNFYGINLNTNIYFLDFFGDTTSPTHSKPGPNFIKGLFIQLSPGLSFMTTKIDGLERGVFSKSNDLTYHISAGLGYDIGLSNLVTFTPFIRYTYHFQASWEGFDTTLLSADNLQNNTSDITEITAGMRLGLYWKNEKTERLQIR